MMIESGDYTEKACANCGEESTIKITLRGIVLYLCWDCRAEMFQGLHKVSVL